MTKRHSPQIIPATAELLTRFYGEAPAHTMRGFVAVLGSEVLAVFGIYHDPQQKSLVLFSDMKPQARAYRKAIVRASRMAVALIRKTGAPVAARADDVPGACRLLERMGFTHIRGGLYVRQPGA